MNSAHSIPFLIWNGMDMKFTISLEFIDSAAI